MEMVYFTNSTLLNLLVQFKMLGDFSYIVVTLHPLLTTQIYWFLVLTGLVTWVVANGKPVYSWPVTAYDSPDHQQSYCASASWGLFWPSRTEQKYLSARSGLLDKNLNNLLFPNKHFSDIHLSWTYTIEYPTSNVIVCQWFIASMYLHTQSSICTWLW